MLKNFTYKYFILFYVIYEGKERLAKLLVVLANFGFPPIFFFFFTSRSVRGVTYFANISAKMIFQPVYQRPRRVSFIEENNAKQSGGTATLTIANPCFGAKNIIFVIKQFYKNK